jgi:hypothetical protein
MRPFFCGSDYQFDNTSFSKVDFYNQQAHNYPQNRFDLIRRNCHNTTKLLRSCLNFISSIFVCDF